MESMNRLSRVARVVAVALVATTALMACNGDEPTSASPTPTETASPPETAPPSETASPQETGSDPQPTDGLPQVTEDPANAGPLPEAPPEAFGDWTVVQGTLSPRGGLYTNSSGDFITATHVPLQTAQDGLERLTEAEFVDNWYCGPSQELEGDDMCFTNAFQAQVYLLAEDIPYDQMTAFGDELLTNWA